MTGKPRIFVDADVIFAGSAAPTEHGASHVILRMGEITLLNCVTFVQAITEVERNLAVKLPATLPVFRFLVSRCLELVRDPLPAELAPLNGQADAKDLSLLVAAVLSECSHLVTFNGRHYRPAGGLLVQTPGQFLRAVRDLLADSKRFSEARTTMSDTSTRQAADSGD